jgi:phage baseplate assembly protein W
MVFFHVEQNQLKHYRGGKKVVRNAFAPRLISRVVNALTGTLVLEVQSETVKTTIYGREERYRVGTILLPGSSQGKKRLKLPTRRNFRLVTSRLSSV